MHDDFCFRRLPVITNVGTCEGCGLRVLIFPFPDGVSVLWDPTAFQRRWTRAVMSARVYALGPPWASTFGAIHVCGVNDRELKEIMNEVWEVCYGK